MEVESNSVKSACGIYDCPTCTHYTRGRCNGCSKGNTLLQADGEPLCEIYQCVLTHDISTCSQCSEPVCTFVRTTTMVCPVRAHYEKKRCYAHKIADSLAKRQPVRQEVTVVSKKLDKAVARLPWYLFAVEEYIKNGLVSISSADIARKVGVESWVVRRDLSQFGEYGRPSLGYNAEWLHKSLTSVLHLNNHRKLAWVGAARIEAGKSLISRFTEHNFDIVAIFDHDTSRAPEMVGGIKVWPIEEMPQMLLNLEVDCAIVAVSHELAQDVADVLVTAGIKGILNLSSMPIAVPSDVCVRNIDVAAEMFALSFYCAQIHGDGEACASSGPDSDND